MTPCTAQVPRLPLSDWCQHRSHGFTPLAERPQVLDRLTSSSSSFNEDSQFLNPVIDFQASVPEMDTANKRTLTNRLDIDGLREFFASSKRVEKFAWLLITITSYFCAAYISYLTVLRFDIGRKIIFSEHSPPSESVFFPPDLTLCQAAFWNKTYLEETIEIPQNILEKAMVLGLDTKSKILYEFSRYISYYNLIYFEDTDERIREEIWQLMTDLYEETFRYIDFSDIVSDAVIRSSIVEKCWYKTQPYDCRRAATFAVDSPSCYGIPISYGLRSGFEYDSFERAVVKFEINLPTKHVFDRDQNIGLKFLMTPVATPFNPYWAIPANTHAVILFHHREQKLQSECLRHDSKSNMIDPDFQWPQTYESCLGRIFEMAAKNICSCYFISGSYYPKNDLACSPNQVRRCLQTEVFRSLSENPEVRTWNPEYPCIENEKNSIAHITQVKAAYIKIQNLTTKIWYLSITRFQKYNALKQQCQRDCWTDNIIATVTYYDLENVSSDHIRNVITLRPNLDHGISEGEKNLTNIYAAFSEVGGVLGVYTGMSIAAFVRLFALIAGAGLKQLNLKVVKPVLATTSKTPLSVRWNLIDILVFRRHSYNRAFEFANY